MGRVRVHFRDTMKTVWPLSLILLLTGCQNVAPSPARVPTKSSFIRQYSLDEIERGSASLTPSGDPLSTAHPVFPTKEEFGSLRKHVGPNDTIWYFRSLDSGWAVVRRDRVIWVLVTDHEY
jgi:hypothetical protein